MKQPFFQKDEIQVIHRFSEIDLKKKLLLFRIVSAIVSVMCN